MNVINTNVASLYAQMALGTNARGLTTVMEQLSTGKRLSNAVVDVAGLAISTRLSSQIRGLNQALRNANDGISLIQTADGSTEQVSNMLQRMRELALEASNSTNNDSDRSMINIEFGSLATQINKIAEYTQWNGANVLDSSGGSSGVYSFQVGANAGQTISITLPDMRTGSTSKLSDINGASVTSTTTASAALGKIGSALDVLSWERANMGAVISRLQFTSDNLSNVSVKTQESRSRIEDTDYSQATSELAKRSIIQQAAQAMLAQANQMPSMILQLLK